jgi:DNA-binding NarL/FixJ family response regulator
MKAALAKKPLIRIAVVESDPLRFVGFRAVFHSERDLELISSSLPSVGTQQNVDLVLLGDRSSQNLFDVMATLKATRPNLRIIVIGCGMEDETILKAIAFGAKGYVDAAASPADFVHAIRVVSQGSVCAPRRVLSIFIERVSRSPGRILPAGRVTFTDREREVLEMLVGGRIEQGNWRVIRHRRAYRQSPRCKVAAQEWCTEPHRAFGTCRYAFAGFLLVKAKLKAKAELRLFVVVHAKSRRACVVADYGIGGKHGTVYAESVSNAWLQSRILRPQT